MNQDYIKGFFDGEGNLKINLIKRGSGKKAYQLVCRIYSSDKCILEKIKFFIGYGNIYSKKNHLSKETIRSKVFELVISKKEQCLNFLNNIRKLSVLKRDQIEFLYENFNFKVGESNIYFDIDKFRSFITRKGVDKLRKNNTIKPSAE